MSIKKDLDTQRAVTRHCGAVLRDLGVKTFDEVQPHLMDWRDLNKAQNTIITSAKALVEKITDDMKQEDAEPIAAAHDASMSLYDRIEHEKDIRAQIGNRGPRSQNHDPRRPNVDGIASGIDDGIGDTAQDTRFGLTGSQELREWARAKGPDEFRSLGIGQYFRAMVLGAKTDIERRALLEGTDSAGGYTTPTDLSARLIDNLRAESVLVRAGATTVPLTSDSNVIAAVASDPIPAWRAEAAAVFESDPTFRPVTLTPRSLAVLIKVSRELIEDSLNLERELPNVMASAMAAEVDRVGLLGTGTAPQPLGVANVAGIGALAYNAALSAYSPLITARTGIKSANAGPVTAFIVHPRDEGKLLGLADTTGQPITPPKAVSDIPMLTTTAIPTNLGAGTNESIMFAGNWRRLLLGVRMGLRVEVLRERFAENLQYGFIAHLRVDYAVENPSAFYKVTGVRP